MTETTDTLRGLWDNDTVKILAALAALYAAYLLMGAVLDYPLRGQLNSLARLTFLIAVYAMLALALNLHWGYTGLFNIGIAGFMAVGLYTMAMVSKPVAEGPGAAQISGLGMPLIVGVAAGVLAAALLGLLVALPALRLRADYLAIVTIAMSEIVRFIYLSGQFQTFTLFGHELGTGGGRGVILNYEDPMRYIFETGPYQGLVEFVGTYIEGNIEPVVNSFTYAVVLLLFVAGFYWLLKRTGESPFGRVLKAIREDEMVAKSLGKDTNRFKIKSFMLGCGLMGLAGILWQFRQGAVTPNSFRPQITFFIWLALIIGGAGSNTGSVMGAAVFAGILFEGPRVLKNIVTQVFEVGPTPGTCADAVAPIADGEIGPFFAYVLGNIEPLQLVFMGVVLIWLMQRRPEGIMGHRTEEAATIPLARPPDRTTGGEES
jgi:branched-chain amino acid transport system permease protein